VPDPACIDLEAAAERGFDDVERFIRSFRLGLREPLGDERLELPRRPRPAVAARLDPREVERRQLRPRLPRARIDRDDAHGERAPRRCVPKRGGGAPRMADQNRATKLERPRDAVNLLDEVLDGDVAGRRRASVACSVERDDAELVGEHGRDACPRREVVPTPVEEHECRLALARHLHRELHASVLDGQLGDAAQAKCSQPPSSTRSPRRRSSTPSPSSQRPIARKPPGSETVASSS
jgi:hypothetical protein